MHTPDGFITGWICIVMLLVSLSFLSYAVLNLRKHLTKEKIIQMSLLGLIIFAAQMLNFPIASGTSGHLIGAALVAIILGPHATVVVLAAVLLLQCIVFGDGGLLALGVNIFNMGIVASYSAYFVYKKFENSLGILMASWVSVLLASVSASVFLALSGLASVTEIFVAMVSTHAIIGMGEAFITFGMVLYLDKFKMPSYTSLTIGLSFVLLALTLPFASSHPDGMEKVAINLGFYKNAISVYEAPFAEYMMFGSELVAGLFGMLLSFGVVYLFLIKTKEVNILRA